MEPKKETVREKVERNREDQLRQLIQEEIAALSVPRLTEKQVQLMCCIAEHLLRTVPIRSGCPEIERLKIAVADVRAETKERLKS
jgi:hypothetical protein